VDRRLRRRYGRRPAPVLKLRDAEFRRRLGIWARAVERKMAAKIFNVVAVFDLQERIAIVTEYLWGQEPNVAPGAIVEFRNPDGQIFRRTFYNYDFFYPTNVDRPACFSVNPGAETIEIGAEVWFVDVGEG
jgi:hypothetical protein